MNLMLCKNTVTEIVINASWMQFQSCPSKKQLSAKLFVQIRETVYLFIKTHYCNLETMGMKFHRVQ